MAFYRKHLFFCTNIKKEGKKSCGAEGAADMCEYAKKRLKQQDLHGKGKIRVSKAGCLGRCKTGPWLVIYPEGEWHNYQTKEDIDKILAEIAN